MDFILAAQEHAVWTWIGRSRSKMNVSADWGVEREGDRDRQTDRQTDRQRQTDRDRQTER